MPNMKYCQFENTYHDLVNCYNDMQDEPESESEKRYRHRLLKLCREIVSEFEDELNEEK